MWQRFTPYDLRVIGHYLGTLLLFFAALMALPLATAPVSYTHLTLPTILRV